MLRDTAQHYPFLLAFTLPPRKEKEKKKKKLIHAPKPNSLGSITITLRLSAWAESPFIEKATVTKQKTRVSFRFKQDTAININSLTQNWDSCYNRPAKRPLQCIPLHQPPEPGGELCGQYYVTSSGESWSKKASWSKRSQTGNLPWQYGWLHFQPSRPLAISSEVGSRCPLRGSPLSRGTYHLLTSQQTGIFWNDTAGICSYSFSL